jgi:hypothetical protein
MSSSIVKINGLGSLDCELREFRFYLISGDGA